MGMRIYQLPPIVANQIAAGEVIERPASVVKELLENSFDAGTDTLLIEINYGGLNQIKVSDNGNGIVVDDLPLAISAHATSKISTLNDLYAIDTMGFRGEALASIASIAKLSISSRPEQQEHAFMLTVQGEKVNINPCARTKGTTVDVVDLFYNAPVRKRFLKSEKLEFQAIETVVKRFAMSAPHIALTLKHNGKLVLSLPAAHNESAQLTRLTKLFGSAFVKEAIYLDIERSGMRLYGWISGLQFQRSQNDRQWVYINQRMVRDKLIYHALKQVYEGYLHPGRFPACLLYFHINSNEVDVNVHPTKHEVRFQQPRLIHDFFTSQLGDALKSVQAESTKKEYDYSLKEEMTHPLDICEPYALTHSPMFISNDRSSTNSTLIKDHWVILNKRYALIFIRQQPNLVDVIALQRYWLIKQLTEFPLPLASRPLLVPVNCTLHDKWMSKINELKAVLMQVGIEVQPTDTNRILIKTMPIKVPYLDFHQLLRGIAELDVLDQNHVVQLLCDSQAFELNMLSSEERMELSELLFNEHTEDLKNTLLYKELTSDDCRMLLHV